MTNEVVKPSGELQSIRKEKIKEIMESPEMKALIEVAARKEQVIRQLAEVAKNYVDFLKSVTLTDKSDEAQDNRLKVIAIIEELIKSARELSPALNRDS